MSDEYKEEATGDDAYRAILNKIDSTLSYRRRHFDDHWKRYMKLYHGEHWSTYIGQGLETQPSADNPRTYITVNEIGSIINMMLPFMLKRNPKIICKPTKPEEIISAMLQQKEINYIWREYDYQTQLEKAVLWSLTIGHAIGKTGYNLKVDTAIDPAESGEIYYEDYIKEDAPFYETISPFLFLYDLEASQRNLETARWCAQLIPKDPADVMANDSFNKKVIKKIQGGYGKKYSKYNPETFSSVFKEPGKLRKTGYEEDDRWCLIEYWDKKFRKRFIFCCGVEDPLIEEPWPHENLESFPYVMLPFIPALNEPYPIGLVKWLEDHQYELDRHVTELFEFRRTATAGAMYVREDTDDKEEQKYRSGGRIIKVPAPDSIGPIASPSLPPDLWRIEAEIRQNMRNIAGVDELQRGGNLADRTSATEVNTRANVMSLKIDARLKDIDRFVEKIARQTLALIKTYWTATKVTDVAGPMGEYWGKVTNKEPVIDATGRYWIPFSRNDIQGEFDIEIESTSAPRIDPMMERQQFLGLYQTTVQSFPLMMQIAQGSPDGKGKVPDLIKMYEKLLEKFDERDAALYVTSARLIQAPVQTFTEASQNMGQMAAPVAPTNGQAQPGAPPQSDMMGQLLGGLMGGMNTGESQ